MAKSSFGDLLRRSRCAAGLTQNELAERAGLSARGISDLERGARSLPRRDTLQHLLQALDPPPEERAALIAAGRRPVGNAPRQSGPTMPAALPVSLTRLIGREGEIAAVSALIGEPRVRLLTLTGPGGVGKTRLALAVAGQLGLAFPDGVAYIGLAPILAPDLVLPTVARALDVRDAGDEQLGHRLADAVGDRRLLLILDNFEHVVEAGPLVADLLRACPRMKVLVTSRVRLRVSGEYEHPVPPLTVSGTSNSNDAGETARSEAVQLFVARAQEIREDFVLTADHVPVVAAICRRLDGLPLAIELAAARIKVLPLPALLDRLERRLPLLTGGHRDLPARQRTMADTITWSHDLLTPSQQRLFRRLGVFVGGFDLDAAEAVAGEAETQDPSIFDGIASLVEQSLLRRVDGPGREPRFTMLETIREFALEQLAASAEEASIRTAHAGYFLALAERLTPSVPGVAIRPWLTVLEAEHPNLRAALGWLAGTTDAEAFLWLATRLMQFWYLRGHFREGRQWLEQAVARVEGAPAVLQAKVFHGAGQLAHYLGDHERAMPLLDEALAWARRLDRSWVLPHVLLMHGVMEEDLGQYERAEPPLREAFALYQDLGETSHAALTLSHLGIAAFGRGDLPRATEILGEALRMARASGDPFPISGALDYLGLVALERSDPVEAGVCLAEALASEVGSGDPEGIARVLASSGALGIACGQAATGARLLAAAETLCAKIGMIFGLPERAKYDAAADTARATLGEEGFAAAWTGGRALSLDEAIAEAHAIFDAAAATPRPTTPAAPFGLTPRERDVLRLLVEGRSDREIGAALFLSHRTVMRHVTGILAKLGVENRTAATRLAVHHGLA